jgi:hypothetical protein
MASHDAAWPCPKTTDLRVGGPALSSPPRITSKPPAISCGATRQSRSAPPPRSRPRQRAPPRPRPESWARPNREVAAPTDPGASQPVGHAERLLGDGPAVPARNIIFRKAMTPGCWSRAVRSRNRPTMSQRSIKGLSWSRRQRPDARHDIRLLLCGETKDWHWQIEPAHKPLQIDIDLHMVLR